MSTVARRGFTLLETVLAAVLGSLVILAALGLFTVVQRSDKRSQIKMEENIELAHARTTIARTFQFLLMSSDPRPNETETDEFLDKDDERNAADRAEEADEDASSTRLAIQPDLNNPITMMVGTEDRQRRARSQVVTMTLRDSPVLGEGEKNPEQEYIDQLERERILSRAAERLSTRSSGRGSSGSSRSENSNAAMSEAMNIAGEAAGGSKSARGERGGSSGRKLSLREKSGGRGGSGGEGAGSSDRGRGSAGSSSRDEAGRDEGDRDELSASERLEAEDEDRPRAPGVRGVFEILPDGVEPGGGMAGDAAAVRSVRLEEAGAEGRATYSLWWRELPPIEVNQDEGRVGEGGERLEGDRESRDEDRTGDLIDREVQRLADASDASGKRVRLLSGLTTCHWTAFRGRKERDKITAKFDSHLPAFVELELVTASGRRENWIFDVSWTIGPEPGSVLPETPDALNAFNNNPNGNPGDPNNPGGPGGPGGPGDPNKPGEGGGKPDDGGKPTNERPGRGDGKTDQERALEAVRDAIRRSGGGGGGGKGGGGNNK